MTKWLNTKIMSNDNVKQAKKQIIDEDAIRAEAETFFNPIGKIEHAEVLREVIENLTTVDFRELAKLKEDER